MRPEHLTVGGPGAFRRRGRRGTGRTARRGVLRPRAARRRQADGGRNPRPGHARPGRPRHLVRAGPGSVHAVRRRAGAERLLSDARLANSRCSATRALCERFVSGSPQFNAKMPNLGRTASATIASWRPFAIIATERSGGRADLNPPPGVIRITERGTSCAVFLSKPPPLAALLLSAATAPAFANALDSQLQPVASADPARDRLVRRQRGAGHDHRPDRRAAPLSRPARPSGAEVRRRRRPSGLHLVGRHPHRQQARVAGLDAARANAQAPPGPAAPHARRPRQPARRPRDVSRPERSTASTARTSRTRSGRRCRRAASA